MSATTAPARPLTPRAYYGRTGLRLVGTRRTVVHIAYFDDAQGGIWCMTHDEERTAYSGYAFETVSVSDLALGDSLDPAAIAARIREHAGKVIDANGEIVK